MGIDICARWHGQTDEEERWQYTGFSVLHGHAGYLREAYHGEPYATRHLCAEAFESGQALIPPAVLRDRLPRTLALVEERERKLYNSSEDEIDEVQQSYRDFVRLCEDKERQTGQPVRIIASY